MPSVPRPIRALLSVAAAFAALAAGAPSARAEEAIVLDNGAVFRGTVTHEDADSFVFRLAGVGSDTRITIPRKSVAQRFTTVDPKRWRELSNVTRPVLSSETTRRMLPETKEPARSTRELLAHAPALPAEEPDAYQETIFERTARRASIALPDDPISRALFAALGVAVLLCLVGLGAKMADIEGMTLARGTILALLLGGMVAADVLWPRELLRADHGIVVLPLQVLAWVGCAAGILRGGFGRAFLLLAFVVLSGCLVGFATGAVLVSV